MGDGKPRAESIREGHLVAALNRGNTEDGTVNEEPRHVGVLAEEVDAVHVGKDQDVRGKEEETGMEVGVDAGTKRAAKNGVRGWAYGDGGERGNNNS